VAAPRVAAATGSRPTDEPNASRQQPSAPWKYG
jgi:hypothetical protein